MQQALHQQLISLIQTRFGQTDAHILVVGDVMLDRYLFGQVDRISPEAPVPVVLLKREEQRAGGAANVAANLCALGIHTKLLGCVGQDQDAQQLNALLASQSIATTHMMHSPHRPTITKTRILGGPHQMLRLDQESQAEFNAEEIRLLKINAEAALSEQPSLVILSDYAKGLLTRELCQYIIQTCRSRNIPVLVDPKGRDYTKYQGATALTPNKKETAEACGVNSHNIPLLLQEAEQLRRTLGVSFMAVTRGEEGITLITEQTQHHLPASAQQVFDVSGAGDTVIATLAAGLLYERPVSEALYLANIAAGVVVGQVGTVPIQRAALLHALSTQSASDQADKICSLDTLQLKVQQWRALGDKIVFTNGCFDLLHAGHVTYLEAASKLGHRLVLGLNTDRSVSALKGPTRPVIHEQDRARVLAALESIDAVILFDEDTPLQLIQAIRPDVLVKGSDYTEAQVVGGELVKSWGGHVALVDIVAGRSTSNIIKKLAS